MFGNYVTTAIRNLAKHKLYSAINIAGLATGLACCILILLFVKDELSYDKWLTDGDLIQRVSTTFYVPGREPMTGAQTPGPAKAALEKDFPHEIEDVVRIFQRRPTFDLGDRQFNDLTAEVDANFFAVFDLPMVEGDREAALADSKSLILSRRTAEKYFGDEPAIGKMLTVTREGPETFRVAAVMENLPENTHLDIDIIMLFDPEYYKDRPWVTDRWTSTNVYIYAKFVSLEAVERVRAQLPAFLDANVVFQIQAIKDITPSDILEFDFDAVPDIHLNGKPQGGMKPGGDIVTVYTFSAIAVLILIIASINFMNLATARSMERAREVSMRKVLGANRKQLVGQFLGESVLLTLVSLTLAVVIAKQALPFYNDFIDKELAFDYLSDPALMLWLVALTVFVGLIGGLYPAFFLARFRPAKILKANQSSSTEGSSRLRAALVVLQFAISIALIVSTAVVYGQTYYAKNMDLGFNKDHMVVLTGIARDKVKPVQQTIVQEIAKLPGVIGIGKSSDSLPQHSNNNTLVELPEATTHDLLVVEIMSIDVNFFQTLGIEPLAGRLFSIEYGADAMPPDADKFEGEINAGAILNERVVKRLGFGTPEAAVGQKFKVLAGQDKKANITVVGVVRNLHSRSVKNEISPTMYFLGDDSEDFSYLTVHLRSDNLAESLSAIDRIWNDLVPDVPVRRTFMDENFDALYKAEEERGKMFAGFALFAVLVACLGLFGMASFTAERRTREIGIRKVMGASVADIVKLLTWQFSKPVLLANIIAWPVAFYFMQNWLEGFEYRIDLTPLPFVGAGALALVIAVMTVGLHAARVARSSPAAAMRYE